MRVHLAALACYLVLAVLFSWPLPLHLSTHLTGSPDGDAGLYVWNQWVFHHELVEQGSNPYNTDRIFALGRPADLSLHNYTTFANVLALPLLRPLGAIATFNIVYLAMVVLTAYAMFLLARRVTGGAAVESWLAGALFAWAPTLVTRSMAHISLASAAPLPIFVLLLLRAHRYQRTRDAAALGVGAALAAFTDAYYGVFCAMVAVASALLQVVQVSRRQDHGGRLRLAFDVLAACSVALAAVVAVTGGWQFTVAGQSISVRGLYTPVLASTVLVLACVAWRYRASVAGIASADFWRAARLATAAAIVGAVVLSPVLFGIGARVRDDRMDNPQIYWRSSPRGVDATAFLVPNPNHPLVPEAWRDWVPPAGRSNEYIEHVASLPLVGLAVIALVWWRGWRAPAVWVGMTLGFALLALGPFVNVAHVNTYIPGPWALLRYVPVVELARTPSRFVIMALLALAVLFALALSHLRARSRYRGVWLTAVAALLLLELLPAPRTLYPADVPAIYDRIAADPRPDVRVLELPLGIRDGRSSVGNYTARTQFYQIHHGKAVLGGMLSRVSSHRIAEARREPVIDALFDLSEGTGLSHDQHRHLLRAGQSWIGTSDIGYVVIDRLRASAELEALAVRAFGLEWVASERALDLYVPEGRR